MSHEYTQSQTSDYKAIWAIWMQEHVIQWMSFSKQDKKQFRSHYERLTKESGPNALINTW